MNERLANVRRHVVRITFDWEPEVTEKEHMVISGVVASISNDGYAKVIANPVCFRKTNKFAVCFPNSQGYEEESIVPCSAVTFPSYHLCSFNLKPKESGYVKAANFSLGDPKRCKVLDAFFFPRVNYVTPVGFVEGNIIDSTIAPNDDLGIFFHDCPLHEYGFLGSPLFNRNGNLLGISYLDQGHINAWSVWKLRHNFLRKIKGISYVED